jgi:hypothetical protein
MADCVPFTRNYSDLSTDRGFQFEFVCDRCGNGYRTKFRASATGAVNEVLDAASSLLGGLFSTASNLGNRVHSAAWERAREEALQQAIAEMRPDFMQCPKCQSWVCRQSCWNARRGLCKECSPDLGVEVSAAQASKAVSEVWENAQSAEEDKVAPEAWKQTVRASCPQCGAGLTPNAKFCPECGAKLKVEQHCTECGAKLTPGVKFCSECGHKVT